MKIHKMKKLIFILLVFLVLLFLFFLLPVVWSQSIGGERKLNKIPQHPMFDKLRCGEYFVVVEDDEIGFIFEMGPMDLEERAFLPKEFVIIFDNKKVIPTVRFITGKTGTKVMLKISQEDFKRSPCLKRCFDRNRT